ncbi:MAG: hypothetical protein O7F16_03020 [Acidobacteria bacterium]|nr:hypothetical protein [Acidobacteriota bacterium]
MGLRAICGTAPAAGDARLLAREAGFFADERRLLDREWRFLAVDRCFFFDGRRPVERGEEERRVFRFLAKE